SHKYGARELENASVLVHNARATRVARNQLKCAAVNPGYKTFYYDDSGIDGALSLAANLTGAAKIRRATDAMQDVPVARADMARLALLWLVGGWWLDADVACLDDVDSLPTLARTPSCLLAWEGAVKDEPSSPLNWAVACAPRHALALAALLEASDRVLRFIERRAFADRCRGTRGVFCAKGGSVPVLDLTGPAMLGDALLSYAKRATPASPPASLRALREAAGERADDASTWDVVSQVGADVLVMPYCFFRSRGCGHLQERWQDRVLFHHEFDTAWRPTFFHNYLGDDEPGEEVPRRRHARRTTWDPPDGEL
ncbi:hypothetical protein CTAYLR_006688, partial [Chrysophaeum taylorii]